MSNRNELLAIAFEVRDDPELTDLARLIHEDLRESNWQALSDWDSARVLAHRLNTRGYVKR